ncbi:MAG: pyridoxal phosphate-dependent aminotransferase [Desulfobulbaceae bacterium]|nr:pyridoxal phosphate-dependent aminotransferase [Desulfobulbaceae bacterium]
MFSSRLPWHSHPNRLSTLRAAHEQAGEPILDLTESNPTAAGIRIDQAAMAAALADPSLRRYHPDPCGAKPARQAIAAYYRRHGRTVSPASIILTASTSEAYAFLFKLLADPGDEIMVLQPSYPLLASLAGLESLRLVPYPLRYHDTTGWRIDLERLRNLISTRTRGIAVVSPNNPTGSFLTTAELAGLNAICADFGLALIVDEVFLDFPHGPAGDERLGSAVGNGGALTFVLSGLSKVVCLPQLKLSWIQISGPTELCAQAREGLELIADTFLSVGSLVQAAVPALLDLQPAIVKQVRERLDANHATLAEAVDGHPRTRLLTREGGWYALLRVDDDMDDEERVCRLLAEERVLVHPGYFYDFIGDGHLILSLLTPPAIFGEGVGRMRGHW